LEFLPLFIGSFLLSPSSPYSVIIIIIIIIIISYQLSLSAISPLPADACLLLGLLLTSGLAGALPVASPRPPSAVDVLLRPLAPVVQVLAFVLVYERGDHDHGTEDEDVDHHLRNLPLLGEKMMKQRKQPLETLGADHPVDQRERRPAATVVTKKMKKSGGVAWPTPEKKKKKKTVVKVTAPVRESPGRDRMGAQPPLLLFVVGVHLD
jgi:hypothetical protein